MTGLAGRSVVITRAPEDAASMVEAIRQNGGRPICFPTMMRLPPRDLGPLLDAWARRASFDRFVVGSPHALTPFMSFERPSVPVGVACVGAKTAEALRSKPFRSWFAVREVATVRRSEGLVVALKEGLGEKHGGGSGQGLRGRRLFIPRPSEGRDYLAGALRNAGAEVEALESYRLACQPPDGGGVERLDNVWAFTFLSGQTLRCFVEVVPDASERLASSVVAVIGPVAADAARALGIRVDVVAPEASSEALVDALSRVG